MDELDEIIERHCYWHKVMRNTDEWIWRMRNIQITIINRERKLTKYFWYYD